MSNKKIIIYRETIFGSWARDIGTFATVIGAFWVNHEYLDSNNWLDAFLFLMEADIGKS